MPNRCMRSEDKVMCDDVTEGPKELRDFEANSPHAACPPFIHLLIPAVTPAILLTKDVCSTILKIKQPLTLSFLQAKMT